MQLTPLTQRPIDKLELEPNRELCLDLNPLT
jgi:hypothetical protein